MKHKDREKILLERVYRAVAPVYFNTHSMSPIMSDKIHIDKSLARDVTNYVQGKNPDYYHLIMDKCHERKEDKVGSSSMPEMAAELDSLDLIKEPPLTQLLILTLDPAGCKGRAFTATDTLTTFKSFKVDGIWSWVYFNEIKN